jgi:hypothetical protein
MKLTWNRFLRAGAWIVVWTMGLTLAGIGSAQSISTTTVQGTVYLANGQPATGTVQVSWPAFTTASNQAVTAGQLSVPIAADGFLSVNLAPNQGATPAGLFYTAIYQLSDGTRSTEYWVVPAAAQASLGSVLAQLMPAVQAVQAVSKSYVDQAITELTQSLLTASGGTLSGPLYLNGDPSQPLQAADKHYVDTSVTAAESAVQSQGTTSRVDLFPGADFGARLQACVNALSGSYGGTCDGRNFTGMLAMGSNVQIATANATVLLPCATISTASSIVVTAGTRNVSLRGCSLRGTSTASGTQGGTVFLYTGAGAMVRVGDPSYGVDTLGFHLDNVAINTTTATSTGAGGLAAYRTQELDLESLYFLGNSNQTGMTLDGTGNYTGGTFYDEHFIGFQTAVNAIGHQAANAATTDWVNASTFVRLHIDCPTSGGNPIAGTYGINLQQGDGNTFTGGDVEGCATALHLGPNAQNNTIVGVRNENSTNQIVADAGSAYNSWMSGGTMFTGKLIDNGTRNSFLDTFHRSFNGMNGDWYGSQQDATLTNHLRLGIGAGNERGLLNRYQTDYGYRWTMGLSDAAAGEQFYQILDELNNVYRVSIGQYNNGQSSTNNQTVINAAGTGAVVLNGSNGAGTGGVVVGSGGASETTVATINGAGNAQFNGSLQVGGVSTFAGSTTVRNQADAEIDSFLWAGATASQKESFIYKDWNGNSQWYLVKDASNNWAVNSATGGLDSFKAYQSSNSGDTYIDASNASGVVRVNYETGSGAGFKVYGGNSSSLYASFTGTTAIQFPGLAAGSGHSCLQVDSSGYITNTGATCGTGNTNGTVNVGSSGQIAYYSGNGAVVAGENTVPIAEGGTGATTASGALSNLGALPLAGGVMTGALTTPSETVTGTLGVTGSTSLNTLTVQNSITANTPVIDVRAFGAAGDARAGNDGAVAAGATQMTSASIACTAADVGKIFTINDAGASGGFLLATVTSCAGSTVVNFTPAAGTAIASGAHWAVGTDNTAAIQAGINASIAACGATLFFPHGIYFVNGNLRTNGAYSNVCPLNGGYNWFPFRISGDGSGSSYLVQNHPTLPLLTTNLGSSTYMHVTLDHVALLGRGRATTGTLFEDITPVTKVEDVTFLGNGGRCLVQQAERLTTDHVNYLTCRQALIQSGNGGMNESFFFDTQILQPGTTIDPITQADFYTYNVNAANGVFPSSGNLIADMHPAVYTHGDNVFWEGGSMKPLAQGIAGFRNRGDNNNEINHFYIEGLYSGNFNPSIVVGGKNETTATTAAMTASATTFPVADSSWMHTATGNALDVNSARMDAYILYPPDYAYGSTAASSLGGGILKGNYEQVLAVFVQNTAYAVRAQAGTTAYAWPAGTVVNESYVTDPGDYLQVMIKDSQITSGMGDSAGSPYTLVTNPNLQEPGAQIVVGLMPDQFHTWGTGTGSDYPNWGARSIEITGAVSFGCGISGVPNIEIHGLGNGVITYGGTTTDSAPTALNSIDGCGTGAIKTVTYADGATSSFNRTSPNFPGSETIGNLTLTSSGSNFVMKDQSSGATVCSYNGTAFSCNGSSSPLFSSATVNGATTASDAACFSSTPGTLVDCGVVPGTVTSVQAPTSGWPAWLTPSLSNATTTPTLAVRASAIPTTALASVAGAGAGLSTGPTNGTTANDAACFADAAGTLKDCGAGVGTGTVTNFQAAAANWPSWMTPSVSNAATSPALSVGVSPIPNLALANSSTTVAGQSCTLGSSCTISASNLSNGVSGTGSVVLATSPTLVTPTLGNATATSLTATGSLTDSALITAGIVTNTAAGVLGTTATVPATNLPGSGATTVNGQSCALGGSCTITQAPSPQSFSSLTDGSTVTLATGGAGVTNSTLTLNHATSTRALNVTGLVSGAQFTVVLKQDATGGAALTFGTGCTWYLGSNAGFVASTAPSLSAAANGINLLAVLFDGTNCYANVR